MDYGSIALIVLVIFVAIAAPIVALWFGYLHGMKEAPGQIRQSFQIELSRMRVDHKRHESDSENGIA